MNSTKPQLRKLLQRARLSIDPEDRQQKSNAIAANLLQEVYWPLIRNVHCFEPIMRLGEVDLVDFVTALQTDMADIHVYTSRKTKGGWEIVSTRDDKPVQLTKFDAIIVPMLGFDPKTLHRLGYGGGYYDKFLAAQPQAKKIGVCYEACKIDALPNEPHDIPLDLIVTESHTYTP